MPAARAVLGCAFAPVTGDRTRHVTIAGHTARLGIQSLAMEREQLLDEFDRAIKQGSDDPVKTAHGVSCEARFRSFLAEFLPKKYGVTKGYIITPELDYSGPLEEWDIRAGVEPATHGFSVHQSGI